MGGIMNGLALHGGILPVGGTFFIFSDYMRPAVRLAALCEAHVIYSWTHDSVGLGQDGPTHQPVEQLASLRAMPGLRLIRPADANECAHAWRIAVDSEGPTALVLSRQAIPVLEGTADAFDGVRPGRLRARRCRCRLPPMSSSSPPAARSSSAWRRPGCSPPTPLLPPRGIAARVVSLPVVGPVRQRQDASYRRSVLPDEVPTLAVEAAASFGWDRYADDVVAIDHFGASAPGAEVLARLRVHPEPRGRGGSCPRRPDPERDVKSPTNQNRPRRGTPVLRDEEETP